VSAPASPTAGRLVAAPLLDLLVQQRGEDLLADLARHLQDVLAGAAPDAPPLLTGLRASAPAVLCAAWFRQRRQTALCVVPTREGALQLADDLEAWLGREPVVYLPQPEMLIYDRKSPDPALVGDLLLGLDRLRGPEPVLAVTSLDAVRQRVIAPQTLTRAILRLEIGQRLDPDAFCSELARRGYRPAGMVARSGDYARRGGLLDVYAPGDLPLRIELFDDEIVSLRTFDPQSQRGDQARRLPRAVVYPVSHLLREDEALLACLTRLEQAREQGHLDQDAYWDLEARLEEGRPDDGLESFLPWFGPTARVLDYLPDGSPLLWFEPVKLKQQIELLAEELPRLREARLKRDAVLPRQDELLCAEVDLRDRRLRHVWLAEAWIRGEEAGRFLGIDPAAIVDHGTIRPELKGGDIDRLRRHLAAAETAAATVLVLCDNRGQANRLADLLDEHALGPPASRPLVGHLTGGFVWPDHQLSVITDHEFFERYRRQGRVRHRASGLVKPTSAAPSRTPSATWNPRPDGPADLRRCGLRQDRGGHADGRARHVHHRHPAAQPRAGRHHRLRLRRTRHPRRHPPRDETRRPGVLPAQPRQTIEQMRAPHRRTGARGAHPRRPRPDGQGRPRSRHAHLRQGRGRRPARHHHHRDRHRHPQRQHHPHRPRRPLRPRRSLSAPRPRRPRRGKAYAILLLPRDMMTAGDARKRIHAIKQYTALGSGFKIAMRDLEIRGAGNLLGQTVRPHFELYCRCASNRRS
jgi:transcription-repair coupling factor (superfamily II helicase)